MEINRRKDIYISTTNTAWRQTNQAGGVPIQGTAHDGLQVETPPLPITAQQDGTTRRVHDPRDEAGLLEHQPPTTFSSSVSSGVSAIFSLASFPDVVFVNVVAFCSFVVVFLFGF